MRRLPRPLNILLASIFLGALGAVVLSAVGGVVAGKGSCSVYFSVGSTASLVGAAIWQNLDLAPTFPALRRFLAFWQRNLEGKVHSVKVAYSGIITSPRFRAADTILTLN